MPDALFASRGSYEKAIERLSPHCVGPVFLAIAHALGGAPLLGVSIRPDRMGKAPQPCEDHRILRKSECARTGLHCTRHFTLEFVGGILLMLGLFSRPIAFLLACNMFVAYWTADREALTSVFSDPGKFYVADPYTFLFASLMVLIFGAGLFAVDTLIAKRVKAFEQ